MSDIDRFNQCILGVFTADGVKTGATTDTSLSVTREPYVVFSVEYEDVDFAIEQCTRWLWSYIVYAGSIKLEAHEPGYKTPTAYWRWPAEIIPYAGKKVFSMRLLVSKKEVETKQNKELRERWESMELGR